MIRDAEPIPNLKDKVKQQGAEELAKLNPPLPDELSRQVQSMIIGASFFGQFGQLKINVGKQGEKSEKAIRLLVFPDEIPMGAEPPKEEPSKRIITPGS